MHTRPPTVTGSDGTPAPESSAPPATTGSSAPTTAARTTTNDDTGTGGDGTGQDNDTGGGQDDSSKAFTQSEVNDIVARRLAKAEKQWKSQVEQAAERAKMDEADRAKAEKADAEKAADEARREALTARVEASATRAALAADVDPAKVDRFIVLAAVDKADGLASDGQPDSKAITAHIARTLKEWPEFKKPTGASGRSGGEMNGNAGTSTPTSLEQAFAARMGR